MTNKELAYELQFNCGEIGWHVHAAAHENAVQTVKENERGIPTGGYLDEFEDSDRFFAVLINTIPCTYPVCDGGEYDGKTWSSDEVKDHFNAWGQAQGYGFLI